MTTRPEHGRRSIGVLGTAARVVVGGGLIVWATFTDLAWPEVLIGLVAFPAVVILGLLIRGASAEPLRLYGPAGHAINCLIGAMAFVLVPVPSMLFYGTSMLVSAVRGYGGCELFALSNWLRARTDEIACPLFWPLDLLEAGALREGRPHNRRTKEGA